MSSIIICYIVKEVPRMAIKEDGFFCKLKELSTMMFFANSKFWYLALPLDLIWWAIVLVGWVLFIPYLLFVYPVKSRFNKRMANKKK